MSDVTDMLGLTQMNGQVGVSSASSSSSSSSASSSASAARTKAKPKKPSGVSREAWALICAEGGAIAPVVPTTGGVRQTFKERRDTGTVSWLWKAFTNGARTYVPSEPPALFSNGVHNTQTLEPPCAHHAHPAHSAHFAYSARTGVPP